MRTLALLAVLLAVFGVRAAEDPPLDTVEIAPGNFVHYGVTEERSPRNLGDQANVGFIVGDRCVLVVDAGGSPPVGRRLLRAVRARTAAPICYLVLTHAHPDHFFGAVAFAGDGPRFIGHQNLPRQLAARARPYLNALRRDLGEAAEGAQIVQPDITVKTGAVLNLDLGGREVEVRAWPPAHTDDDLTVYDRRTGTMWLSDLLFVGHTPVLDTGITGFLSAMKTLRGMRFAHFVPGHGRTDKSWPAAMDPQQRYFDVILAETRAAIRHRLSLMEALDQVGLSEAENWPDFDAFHRRNVTTAYTELEWEE